MLYRFTGRSDSNSITVSGGAYNSPVTLDLNGVSMDFTRSDDDDSVEAAPVTVKSGAYANIYIGMNNANAYNYLRGGNNHGFAEKNWGYAGLCIEDGAHVTIMGKGMLEARGGGVQYGGAGIGGNYNRSVSELVIEGSVQIKAYGAPSAPGIGSGRDGNLTHLYIRGGNISATGGKYAPGIGAGDSVGDNSGGNASGIFISGGTMAT